MSRDSDEKEETATTEPFAAGGHTMTPMMDYESQIAGSACTSQMEALYYMFRGDNVLLCGQAGTGKSWVIQVLRNAVDTVNAVAKRHGKALVMAMTASTGAAASLVGGRTVHSWSGLGMDVDAPDPGETDENGERIIDKPKWRYAFNHIRSTDILVIDEVSMIPAYFLTNLDKVCRMAKRNDRPFGGIQVIMVGDFLQLPPVSHGEPDRDGNPVDGRLCFYSPSFKALGLTYCYLDHAHRSDDDRLNGILNAIRSQNMDDASMKLLMSRMGRSADPTRTYTRLYTRNRNVNSFNEAQLAKIDGREKSFETTRGGPDYKAARVMQRQAGIPDQLRLKIGAVVMLTSNTSDSANGHVNGSMGRIVGFGERGPMVMFNDGIESEIGPTVIKRSHKDATPITDDDGFQTGKMKISEVTDASVKYIPLKLAWAITVHKSQGQTLDGAIVDLSDCFQKGLGYVAISRVHSLDDLILLKRGVSDYALLLDGNAFHADGIIRRLAVRSRETLTAELAERGNREKLLAMAPAGRRRELVRWLEDHPPISMVSDDALLYEWLSRRARRHSANVLAKL